MKPKITLYYIAIPLFFSLWVSMYRIMEDYGSENGSASNSVAGDKRSAETESLDNNSG